MFRKGEVSTATDKGPFLFTLTALAVGTVVTVLLFVLGGGDPLAVFAGILFAVVTLSAGAVLIALVTDKVYIEGGTLFMSYLFKTRSIPIGEIGKVSLHNEIYSVYDKKGALAGTFNAKLASVGDIILALDKSGVTFV